MNLLPQPRVLRLGDGVVASDPASAPVVRTDSSLPAQGYRLTVGDAGVEIAAADAAGEFYAAATLAQLHRLRRASGASDALPELVIEDWPDVATRGVMLDISRDKVPTLATLKDLIDRLAGWKVNHVQLYMEHTFAYVEHGAVWQAADPLTGDDIDELDAWCRARHVELAPNQNSLGHFERWLKHEPYRQLAIAPDGWVDGRGRQRPPTTLDPANPRALELVVALLGELLPHFSSRRVNVGLDEPWELPAERHPEYVRYIDALRRAPVLDGHEVLMWGDIVALEPGMAAELPDGVTVCEWGYEADHPFAARAAVLRAAGRDFWVCPGTSSWNSILGRTTNMRDGCLNAARVAVSDGAQGFLVTDWGDNGHLQYLPVSEPGFAYAAAVSWCAATNADLDLAAALDVHAFADESANIGAALLALGDAHRGVEPQLPNMSIIALPLFSPQVRMGEGWTQGMSGTDLESVEESIARAAAQIASSRSTRADATLVRDEIACSAALVQLLCRDARARLAAGGVLADVPASTRDAFAREVDEISARHRDLWSARNRAGGLVDSVARLERLAAAYRA